MKSLNLSASIRTKYPTKKPQTTESLQEKRSVNSQKSNVNTTTFETGPIFHHYHSMKEEQHKRLADLNLCPELKSLLFGVSENHYIQERISPDDLIIENHPLKGRFIMTKAKYEHLQKQSDPQMYFRPSNKVSSLGEQQESDQMERPIKDPLYKQEDKILTPPMEVSDQSLLQGRSPFSQL